MKLVDSKYLLALALTFFLAACQSTPDGPESEPIYDEEVEVMPEEIEDTSETYSASERAAIEARAAQAKKMAALLSNTVVYFDFDESRVKQESYESLKAHARYLIDNPGARIRLEGHADERGTREYNVALGERRGNEVAKFLRLSGVSGSQMEVISYGEEKPLANGHNESSWSQNRRVKLNYISGNPN